jgi:hypothetical protein
MVDRERVHYWRMSDANAGRCQGPCWCFRPIRENRETVFLSMVMEKVDVQTLCHFLKVILLGFGKSSKMRPKCIFIFIPISYALQKS